MSPLGMSLTRLLPRKNNYYLNAFTQKIRYPAVTTDNCEMRLFTNAGLSLETEKNDNPHSDGVGLFRTEIPFMMRQRFPTEYEQVELYRGLLAAQPNKPFTMRTLDVGGDKPLPYFPISEENPFLGWRGIPLNLRSS